jgi:hypothetical protein
MVEKNTSIREKGKDDIGRIFGCPLSDRLVKIIGYDEDGLPIIQEIDGRDPSVIDC